MTGVPLTILDNEYATIWCYPEEKILHHQLHQYFFGDTFREILTISQEAFEKYHCVKWLSDDRHFGAILPDDKAWGDTVWRPRMLDAGWKFWAMVLPDKVTGKLNIQKMVHEYEELGVAASFHTDPDAAMVWLREQ
ncbi:MAG: hypothetical protein JXX29_13510 [Deltaproteobacteria bacterium]|nr:hypothetical protein [Deltaproteobacteria bacterium]MBN2672696.1 hypothetical protein [Deltaproteobacteria bacterium]